MEIKDKTLAVLKNIYDKNGIFELLNRSRILLEQSEQHNYNNIKQRSSVKGEVAEVVLFCLLHDFQKYLPYETYLLKGLYVQDPDTNQVTEIDVVFITPLQIYLFESKSYSGKNKVVKDICKLYRNNVELADVFEQSKLHALIFNKVYGGLTKKDSKPYTIAMFDYATNRFKDERTENKIPILNEDNIIEWLLQDLKKRKEVKVKVKRLGKKLALDIKYYSKSLSIEHRSQLKY